MVSLLVGFLFAFLLACLLRPRLPFWALAGASGAAGVVATELAANVNTYNPVVFGNLAVVVPGLLVAVALLGVVVAVLARAGYAMVGSKGPWPALTPAESLGVKAAVVALVALGAPFIGSGTFGSVPLATYQWWPCVLLLATLCGWLVGRHPVLAWPGHWCAVAAVLLAVGGMFVGPPSVGLARQLFLISAWPLAGAALVLVVASARDIDARLGPRSPGVRAAFIGGPLVGLAAMAVGFGAVAISVSPEARAAMHPSVRAAFSGWALMAWDHSRDYDHLATLDRILENRVAAQPAWFLNGLPGLLADPDPALRLAGVTAMGWANAGFPPGTMDSLLRDPEERVREQALQRCLTTLPQPPPDDAVLSEVLGRCCAKNALPDQQTLVAWLGQQRVVRIEVALLLDQGDGPARRGMQRAAAYDEQMSSALAAAIIADPDPKRRELVVLLLSGDQPWAPPPGVVPILVAMLDEPGPQAKQAADLLLKLDGWAQGRPGKPGSARGTRLPVDLRMRLHLQTVAMDADPNTNQMRQEDPADAADAVLKSLASDDPAQQEEGLRAAHASWWARPDDSRDAAYFKLLTAIMKGPDADRARRAAALAFGEQARTGPGQDAARAAIAPGDDQVVRILADLTEDNYQVMRGSNFLWTWAAPALWNPDAKKRADAARRIVLAVDAPDQALADPPDDDSFRDLSIWQQRPLADTQEAAEVVAARDAKSARAEHLARIAAAADAWQAKLDATRQGGSAAARRTQDLQAQADAGLSPGEQLYRAKRQALCQGVVADQKADPAAPRVAAAITAARQAVADGNPLAGDIALMQIKYVGLQPPEDVLAKVARPLLYWCWDRLLAGDAEPLRCARKEIPGFAEVLSQPIRNAHRHLDEMVAGKLCADDDACLWDLAQVLDPTDTSLRGWNDYLAKHQPELKAAQAKAAAAAKRQHDADAAWDDAHADAAALSPWATARGADDHGRWADLTINGATQRFRLLRPGTFTMGSTWVDDWQNGDEHPHQVTLTQAFWMADSPCTEAMWFAVLGRHDDQPPFGRTLGDAMPIIGISHDDATGFCAALNVKLPTAKARLPTDAEWEYACRAGTMTAWAGPDLDALAWYGANSGHHAHPVRTKQPNAWGLYDMHGEVSEWCADWWSYLGSNDPVIDPKGPADGEERVIRGSSYDAGEYECRSAHRDQGKPNGRRSDMGFRFAVVAAEGP